MPPFHYTERIRDPSAPVASHGLPMSNGKVGVLRRMRGNCGKPQDAVDVEAFDKQRKEPTRSFEQVLKDLTRNGPV